MLLVVCQLSRDVIGYEDSKRHWCFSIHLFSQLSVLSFSRSQFCLILSISSQQLPAPYKLQFSDVCSKLQVCMVMVRNQERMSILSWRNGMPPLQGLPGHSSPYRSNQFMHSLFFYWKFSRFSHKNAKRPPLKEGNKGWSGFKFY